MQTIRAQNAEYDAEMRNSMVNSKEVDFILGFVGYAKHTDWANSECHFRSKQLVDFVNKTDIKICPIVILCLSPHLVTIKSIPLDWRDV